MRLAGKSLAVGSSLVIPKRGSVICTVSKMGTRRESAVPGEREINRKGAAREWPSGDEPRGPPRRARTLSSVAGLCKYGTRTKYRPRNHTPSTLVFLIAVAHTSKMHTAGRR